MFHRHASLVEMGDYIAGTVLGHVVMVFLSERDSGCCWKVRVGGAVSLIVVFRNECARAILELAFVRHALREKVLLVPLYRG